MPRLLAIGDIHGCSRALDALLLAVQPTVEDRLVFLGDYVDRGPDSRGVLERLLALHAAYPIVALRGNHELMMMAARRSEESLHFWLTVGGREALNSYSPSRRPGRLDDVPEAHWDFLRHSCADWFETSRHFFVHANVDPDVELRLQTSSMLHWEHFNQFSVPHLSGKVMLCGHSEQKNGRPLVLPHAICVDTYCYASGWLTCLDVLTGQMWQANQRGETREGPLEKPA